MPDNVPALFFFLQRLLLSLNKNAPPFKSVKPRHRLQAEPHVYNLCFFFEFPGNAYGNHLFIARLKKGVLIEDEIT